MSCGCFGGLGALAAPRKSGKVKIGYWDIRGLAAPLRMMLEYVGADYEDKRYSDPNEWFGTDKPKILKKNALANLPYVVDGNVVVCQTNAVIEYLGDRFDLSGSNMAQKRLNMQALCEIYDLRNDIINLVYPFSDKCRSDAEFVEKMTAHCDEGHKGTYGKLEAFFQQNGGPYSCGANICTADFHIFEMLDQHEIYASNCGKKTNLSANPMLASFYAKFKRLPQLQKYFGSPAYKLTCNAGGISYTSKLWQA